MKAVIISHGDLSNYKILENECENSELIICADGGAEFAYKYGIVPNYLIGDFDSINEEILEHFKTVETEIIKYSCEKDLTDTEICVYKALELKCDEICILAGIGGRMDHSLGNIGLLHIIENANARGYIAAEDCYIYLCIREINIYGKKGDILSILPFKGEAKGVYLSGLKYPLNNFNIPFGSPIGISNIMLSEKCNVKIQSGELLILKNTK
jgi:thiamine pyrophosphokinase